MTQISAKIMLEEFISEFQSTTTDDDELIKR